MRGASPGDGNGVLAADGVICANTTHELRALKTGKSGWNGEQGFGGGKSDAGEVSPDCGEPCRSCKECGALAVER